MEQLTGKICFSKYHLNGAQVSISLESFYYTCINVGNLFHGSAIPYDIPFPLDWGKSMEQLHAFIEEKLEELLTDELHGSGWDGDWSVDRTDKGFVCTIGYHHMDESGYYDGWTTFTITTDKDLNVVSIKNDADEETIKKYLWDEYHHDTLYETFEGVKMQLVRDNLLLRHRVAPEA